MNNIANLLNNHVVKSGICTGCGACISLDKNNTLKIRTTENGAFPDFSNDLIKLSELAWIACPGKGINYPKLYNDHYGNLPTDWLLGNYITVRVGYSADDKIRKVGASGGIISQVLIHLLQEGIIDAAIVVQQGLPTPEKATAIIVNSVEGILKSAQSVYIPVPTLDILSKLEKGKKYAITCLPDQAAALRQLQIEGFEPAKQITFVLGPYTGTALKPSVISFLMRSNQVPRNDEIESLRWRAGDWPGYLEILTKNGIIIRSKKVYYNYLIPFFITQSSLQGMDFTNEFCDLSVGDAWSPKYESLGQGVSVFISRSMRMEEILLNMIKQKMINQELIDPKLASDMHGHMIDFKKRGSYLRNQFRNILGMKAPDYGIKPVGIKLSRIIFELILDTVFIIGNLRISKSILSLIPEKMIGPVFNKIRIIWKSLSKPTKRKGLGTLMMETYSPEWSKMLDSDNK